MQYMLLHAHHQNLNGCPLSVGHLAARVRQIKSFKPKNERRLRISLIRRVGPEELPVKARKAWAAYDKAWAAHDKAMDAYGWAAYDKGWAAHDKAWGSFLTSLTPAQWDRWHREACKHPECKWTADHPRIF